ncbi:MAG: hypothetical protein OEY49_07915 [Candidatus Heimdallarchaeota archaeon]|nr:hypothetical protein [Candidatus Heimdallarchaeota archaeon]
MAKNANSLIRGIILTLVGDEGPEIIANLSDVSQENALITALHLISLAGLEETDDKDSSKIIGPLPVKGSVDLKSLYYSDVLTASNMQDERLKEHGATIGIILLFNSTKLPEIRRSAGLIEPYLQLFLSKISQTSEVTPDFAMKLRDHIVDIITKPRIRTFWMDEEGIYEYADPSYIRQTDNVMVLDENEKRIYVLTQKTTSIFTIRKMRNKINELNFEFYQGGFAVSTLENFTEIEPLLMKHGIQVR